MAHNYSSSITQNNQYVSHYLSYGNISMRNIISGFIVKPGTFSKLPLSHLLGAQEKET
jgi:hypothetical protein